MREFLDVADTIRDGLQPNPLREQFDLVFKAIAELQAVFAKSTIDLSNIESVFAAFEMADLFGRLGTLQESELRSLTSAIKSVIVTTLEKRLRFPVRDKDRHILPPRPYDEFAQLIRQMREVPTALTVMTFNYELAVDYAFYFNSIPTGYCLALGDTAGAVPLLKLHGSLNWTRCPHCKAIHAVEMQQLLKWPPLMPIGGDVLLPLSQYLPQCGSCGVPSVPEPLIIPPTWNKTQHYAEIRNVWSVAARHLSEAENIVVIGYSLPDTDHFFHYLYALGTVGTTRLKRFWITNPDDTIRKRFESLLGLLAKERVIVDPTGFGEDMNRLRHEFARK